MARASTFFAVLSVLSLAASGADEPALGTQVAGTAVPPGQVAASAHFSAAFVKAMLARTIEDTQEFSERIIGADVHNVARSTTFVDAELIDDPDNVVIDLVLRGKSLTESHGWQRPVNIYTFSQMPFAGRKRICVNGKGVSSTATSLSLKTTTSLNGITNRKDQADFLLARLAQRIYCRSLAEANQQIERNSRDRIGNRVDAELALRLQQAQLRFDAVFDLLERQLKRPHELRFSSTPTSANVALQLLDGKQGDKIAAPPPMPASWDIAFRVHERVAGGLACTTLAGRTYPIDEIDTFADESLKWFLAGMEPNSKPPHDRKSVGSRASEKQPDDAVTITFAHKDPLRIDFADQRIRLVITTTNYRVGGQDYQGFRLRLSLRVAGENGRLAVIREGPAQIEAIGFPTEKQKNLPRVEQAFLRQVFEQGTERIALPDMNLPALSPNFGGLVPQTPEARNQWLILAWRANAGRKD